MTNEPLKATQPLPCPNPWCESHARPERNYVPFICRIEGGRKKLVACPVCPLMGPICETEAKALTAWNTRAVNSHHDLIEALRAVKAELQAAWEARTLPAECVSGETIRKINAALTKAEAGR